MSSQPVRAYHFNRIELDLLAWVNIQNPTQNYILEFVISKIWKGPKSWFQILISLISGLTWTNNNWHTLIFPKDDKKEVN